MGRMSFTQELKALATADEGMDAGGHWPQCSCGWGRLGLLDDSDVRLTGVGVEYPAEGPSGAVDD
jgi:hypothetical protein